MSRNLHVGTVYRIEYGYPGLYGADGQDALYDIFRMFGVDTSTEDRYVDDYEVERTELERLREDIISQKEIFQKYAEPFEKALKRMEQTREGFIKVLDRLINDSDQQNSWVFISWF